MEITIISAQGLKNTTTWPWRFRPFATLSTVSTTSTNELHITSVDETIRNNNIDNNYNAMWGDKFHLSIDASLFLHGHLCIYIQIYSKNFLKGRSELGWCMISAADVFNGLLPAGFLRQFSYRLRNKDGSRGNGVVNVAVKLDTSFVLGMHPQRSPLVTYLSKVSEYSPVLGIPLTASSTNMS
ncbi:hypothetical protein EJD97_004231 [Solanum chilense]|uniref:C2 domain-containing protein n=1 Tax=Solanum chilense TaxID=4083 RepID=A0A6N2CAW6_SOLCI|nr:hypothetical protein EJD97_004231 [Solanum chilense]